MQLHCYDQVPTGTLSYGGRDRGNNLVDGIGCGERPFRPTDPSQNRWLQYLSGVRLRPVGAMDQNNDMSFLLDTVYFRSPESLRCLTPPRLYTPQPVRFHGTHKESWSGRRQASLYSRTIKSQEARLRYGSISDASLLCSSKVHVTRCNSTRFEVVMWCVHEGYLTRGPVQPYFVIWNATDGGWGVEEIEKTLRSRRV
jgi:hypothetical protein